VSKSYGVTTGLILVAALVAAALLPALRLPLLVLLLAGTAHAPRDSTSRWLFAAGVPVAIILAWGDLAGSRLLADQFDCADPISPVAWLRVGQAAIVIGAILLLARHLGTSLQALGLRWPTRSEALLGVVAVAFIPIPSLYVGAILAEPFFGPVHMDLSQPLAIVPALALAIANGSMEELAYRGALMSWLSRAAGPTVGLVGQAVIFGAAHTGTDYVASALPVVLAIMAGGLIAGLIARRTGSLWLPIIVHICFDVPLYYAATCRLN
jgi:membrane protease YdiL (CAAX protease family)